MDYKFVLSVLILLCCLQSTCVARDALQISPRHIRVSEEPNTVTVSCTTETPLDGCQFKWWDFYGGEGPTVDLSSGAESTPDPAYLSENLTNYTYSGRGLAAGDCGLTLQVEGWKAWMIACRVKPENGAWSYKWTDLYAQGWGALSSFAVPREAVALSGGLAKFLVLTNNSMTSCHFFLPDVGRLNLDEGDKSSNSSGNHLYYGMGLDRGECGLVLRNVSAEQNGLVRAWVATEPELLADTYLMALIVARPPADKVTMTHQKHGNATVYRCVVDGRPLPGTVTWTLGDQLIRQDGLNDHPGGADDAWNWPWMDHHMEQRVMHRHGPGDEGKAIKCSFSNIASHRPVFGSFVYQHQPITNTSLLV